MTEAMVDETTRKLWTNCPSCRITMLAEAHPEYGDGPLPQDPEDYEGFGAFGIDCLRCGTHLDWEGGDPTTTWEESERARARAFRQHRDDSAGEAQPGTFWELSVLRRFANRELVDMDTVRSQVKSLVEHIERQEASTLSADDGGNAESLYGLFQQDRIGGDTET